MPITSCRTTRSLWWAARRPESHLRRPRRGSGIAADRVAVRRGGGPDRCQYADAGAARHDRTPQGHGNRPWLGWPHAELRDSRRMGSRKRRHTGARVRCRESSLRLGDVAAHAALRRRQSVARVRRGRALHGAGNGPCCARRDDRAGHVRLCAPHVSRRRRAALGVHDARLRRRHVHRRHDRMRRRISRSTGNSRTCAATRTTCSMDCCPRASTTGRSSAAEATGSGRAPSATW